MPSKPRNSTKKNWVSRFRNKQSATRRIRTPKVIASSPLKPKKPITYTENWQNQLNI